MNKMPLDFGVERFAKEVETLMTAKEERFNVTRWCCREGYCFECHDRRAAGAPLHPMTAARVRVVQGWNLTAEQVQKWIDGWPGFEPKAEKLS